MDGAEKESLLLEPVAHYRCGRKYRFETPRQSVDSENLGVVVFEEGRNFEQAIADLAGFDRVWILFQFHLNRGWKPKVSPPVAPLGNGRIGVFATRSPHRPNPLGLSCVELEGVEGLELRVRNCDLLDGTPVFDVKPYIPRADSFPESRTGWLERVEPPEQREVLFTPEAQRRADFLGERGLDIANFCRVQLGTNPLDSSRKRLYRVENGGWEIGVRTWRIRFLCEPSGGIVTISGIRSHYSREELLPGTEDRYGDKDLHRFFLAAFPENF